MKLDDHCVAGRLVSRHGRRQRPRAKRRFLRSPWVWQILNYKTGTGQFSETVLHSNGTRVMHSFAWATGMGCLLYESSYRRQFNEPVPSWLVVEHPYIRACLLKLAVEKDRRLPASKPHSRRRAS